MESNQQNDAVAPFVLKTYQMVTDPTTDDLIGWSKGNNSFIVADPLELSRRILPSYFKHNNFSSFVRQLNTYGFKKVDPDKWEFASQWFLRDDDGEIAIEISKLKQEQRALELEVESMNKRIEATEKRPQQMMAFLSKIMDNPEILPRIILQNHRVRRQLPSKRRRLVMPPPSPTPVKVESVLEEDSSPDPGVFVDNVALSSPETTLWWDGAASAPVSSPLTSDSGGGLSDYISLSPPDSDVSVYGIGGVRDGYMAELVDGGGSRPSPPYPFSLFSGGF
ncbi:heat stress transcription factor C-1-like [Cucumis melo var. makuwa]|uniref:Heat stress transcription factor C-1-like n=1 Tax=Cucumis melo var. makuwa TaxID=1194695 RepID=A0A5D3CJW8_CUCMM|nr:heat stress transcription factor C-1-like [Cucumis melo var. makuwa]TYK10716.1 heat stress transcription factor C-1-like [Cucumis melo var. makuwa]